MGTDVCTCNGPHDKKTKELEQKSQAAFQPKGAKKYARKKRSRSEKSELIRELTQIDDIQIDETSTDFARHLLPAQYTMHGAETLYESNAEQNIGERDEIDNHHEAIHALCLHSGNMQQALQHTKQRYSLDECQSLTLIRTDLGLISKHIGAFTSLHHLEIIAMNHQQQRLYPLLNQILQALSNSLISLKLRCGKRTDNRSRTILRIPRHLEWLSVQNVDCMIDIQQCELIALQLLSSIAYKQMIWQQTEIPFLMVCDGSYEREWLDQCMKKSTNAKFVCLLEQKSYHTSELKYSTNPIIEKFGFENYSNHHQQCIVLNNDELQSGELFTQLLQYKFGKDLRTQSQKRMLLQECKWVQRIGDLASI